MDKNGFSLVEVIVSLGILSILAFVIVKATSTTVELKTEGESFFEIGSFVNEVKIKINSSKCLAMLPLNYLYENVENVVSFSIPQPSNVIIDRSVLNEVIKVNEKVDYRIYTSIFQIEYRLKGQKNPPKKANIAVVYFKTDLLNKVLTCSGTPIL